MVNQTPYLPIIMEGIVSRVNQAFATRTDDPFNVYFAKGTEGQVSRDLYNDPANAQVLSAGSVLIWLVMNYVETIGKDVSIYGEAVTTVNILCPTDASFTQDQRDQQNFLPRLIPVYEVLCKEIARERWFQFKGSNAVYHLRVNRPYWGGGDVNGTNQTNLFKKFVDAISLHALQIRIKSQNCQNGDYPIQIADGYPAPPQILVFEDDMEIIVDGGTAIDPLDGASSISIPSLAGKDYGVIQRNFGKLRQDRNIEVTKDPAGGFALLQGYTFRSGDTYIINIRPRVAADVTGLTGTLTKGVTQVFLGSNS